MRIYVESTIPSYVVARPARDLLQAARQQLTRDARRKNSWRTTMSKTTETQATKPTGDLVLKEIWRIKDTLSASYGHDVDRLFTEARERQKRSGHPVVNLQTKRRKG